MGTPPRHLLALTTHAKKKHAHAHSCTPRSPWFFKSTFWQKDLIYFYSPVKNSKNVLVVILRKAE